MGNDGGSIPKRGELVRTKQKRTREDDADRVRQLWAFCALSKVCQLSRSSPSVSLSD